MVMCCLTAGAVVRAGFEGAIAAASAACHAGKSTWDRELAAAAHQLLVEWQQELEEGDD